MTKRKIDFKTGDRFGSRVLISDAYTADSGRTYYDYRCSDCGKEGAMSQGLLKQSISCCDLIRRAGRDVLRVVWDDMHGRCHDPKHPAYNRYNGLGISGWPSYLEFKKWAINAGYRQDLEMDRIDNSKGYSPENCQFVTRSENNRNRSSNRWITAFGVTRQLCDWSELTGIDAQTIAARIDRYGWPVEEALRKDVPRSRLSEVP